MIKLTGVIRFFILVSKEKPLDFFTNQLVATDEVEGDVSNTIKVIKDDYTKNMKKPGVYEVIVAAKDKSNNISTKKIEIQVVKDSIWQEESKEQIEEVAERRKLSNLSGKLIC